MDTRSLLDLAQLANMVLLPLVIYIVRIEKRLSELVTLIKAHEEADEEKFECLFAFKADIERRGRDRLLEVQARENGPAARL